MEYRVLGPLTAVSDGQVRNLGGARQRMVLAVLLAHPDRVVSQDALIDAVWSGDPPAAAKTTLHGYVSHLRREVGDDLIREGDGYRVAAGDDSLDVLRFERLVDEGRHRLDLDPAAAAVVLEEALKLWYGSPYGDLGDSTALMGEVARLEELRQVAVEYRIEADLALGSHAHVVGELETLVREHPYREKLHGMLMLALYRSGRQAEALRAYQRTRDLLAELGIEPSTELRHLEQRILDQDPDLELQPVARSMALLFTDIEGSTLLWELYPDGMPTALAQHDRLLGEVVRTAGGKVFKEAGDGMCAAFPDVDGALAAARLAQEGLAAADWGEIGSLKVRMAIDVGEVEERGADYFGTPLNRCARMMASGHGGQVLVSDEVKESSGADDFTDLGEHRFAGLGRPLLVSQLVVPGLPTEFPPLRTDRRPRVIDEVPTRTVRGYELRETIGEGDYGVVHRAFQPSVGREVAVKMIRPEYVNRPAFVRRFETEAHLIAELSHPHIVSLHDFWRDPEGAYLVMPLLRGGSLTETLRRGPWNLAPALRLLDQVGSAVGYAHRQGVIHRDIKPGNVLLDEEGNGYLSDFGIATRLIDDAGAPLTTSVAYVPPEEIRGEPLTARSDIFSLGVLAFQIFSGVHPTGHPPRLSLAEARTGLPVELGEVLERATDDDPGNRYDRVEDFLRAMRRAVGADVVAVSEPSEPAPAAGPARNPYKGLRAFLETDAVDFHGRDALVDELLRAVGAHKLVAVVGPSGSGKSSVVRAGLVTALRAGGLPTSRGWLITEMFPGSYPFEELEAALLRVATSRPPGLIDDLTADERGLLRVSKQILPPDDSELVLIIDQFEELFSMLDSEATRRRFLDSLATVAGDERSRVRVVVTLRADFFDRPLEYPEFGEVLTAGLVTVSPPAEEGLAQAIAAPARGVGVDLEPGLVGRVIADVEGQPGGLPLLQYALTELFNRRDDNLLTIATYEATGGVIGALGRRAEELYQQLPPAGREAARQLFLRLVTVDEASDDTRRRVRQRELKSLAVDQRALDRVLQDFGAFRLLSFDRDPVTRGPTVEVAHEALLREWDRLRDWVDGQREDLVFHRRLHTSAREWEEAGRDPSFLLRGGRLEQAERWAGDGEMALTGEEEEFIAASGELREEEEAASRRRRRRAIGSLLVALTVFAVLAVVAFVQRERAENEARTASARRLAGDSTLALAQDPELAILLALESAYLSRGSGEPLLPETIAALQQATQASRLEFRLDDGLFAVAVSPDGSLLATDSHGADSRSDVVIWDAVTGERMRVLPGEVGEVFDVAFSPDGETLAVSYFEYVGEADPPRGFVGFWDPVTGEEIGRVGGATATLEWSPDGTLLATTTSPQGGRVTSVTVWDIATGRQRFSVEEGGLGVAFLDETLLVSDRDGDRVLFYDTATGEETDRLVTGAGIGEPLGLSVDPGRSLLMVGFRDTDLVELWDLETRSLLWSVVVPTSPLVHINPETGMMVSGGIEGTVNIHDPDSGSVVAKLAGLTGPLEDFAFYPDGERLVSVDSAGGGAIVLDLTPSGHIGVFATEVGALTDLRLSADGSEATITSVAGVLERFDLATGETLGSFEGKLDLYTLAPVSPDWRFVAYVDHSDEAAVRDLATGDIVTRLPACTVPRGFSHDGSLLVLDGVVLCDAGEAPAGAELRSRVIVVATGEEILDLGPVPFGGGWPGAVFNPGGVFEQDRFLAETGTGGGGFGIYDLAGDEPKTILLDELGFDAISVVFDPTGRYLAAVGDQGDAVVLDMARLVAGSPPPDAVVFSQTIDTGQMISVALDANGVLATSTFGSLRLWDVHTGELIVELPVEGAGPPFPRFSSDGAYLYYNDDPGLGAVVVRRYPLDTDQLVEFAEGW